MYAVIYQFPILYIPLFRPRLRNLQTPADVLLVQEQEATGDVIEVTLV